MIPIIPYSHYYRVGGPPDLKVIWPNEGFWERLIELEAEAGFSSWGLGV